MINTNELRAEIVRCGLTQEKVAKELNMSPKTFYSRMRKGIFNSDEIESLISLLDIKNPMKIFFVREVS